MKKKFAVIGIGHFGAQLALDLTEAGAEVIAVDKAENRLAPVKSRVAFPMACDATDFHVLSSLGLSALDAVIVSIGEDFESSLLTISHLQEIGVQRLIARVINPTHERILKSMKVEELILPESESATRLAKTLTIEGLLQSYSISGEYSIVETEVPLWMIGKSMGEVQLREKFLLNLITIKKKVTKASLFNFSRKETVEVMGVIDRNYQFVEKDVLVLFGDEAHIKAFMEV